MIADLYEFFRVKEVPPWNVARGADMFHNAAAIRQLVRVTAGTAVLVAIELIVYALIGRFTVPVLIGALVGFLLSCGNFMFLSITVSHASDMAEKTGDAQKATLSIRASSTIRMLVLFAVYAVILAAGICDALAAILPLFFVQVSLNVTEYFRKDSENKQ